MVIDHRYQQRIGHLCKGIEMHGGDIAAADDGRFGPGSARERHHTPATVRAVWAQSNEMRCDSNIESTLGTSTSIM